LLSRNRRAKVYRIGCLLLPPLAERPSVERQAFLQGLRDLGYNEGRNITIEYQSAAWNRELRADLAADRERHRIQREHGRAGWQEARAIREAVPQLANVAVIWNLGNLAATSEWKEIQAAARSLGIKLESVEVRGADDFVAALRRLSQRSRQRSS